MTRAGEVIRLLALSAEYIDPNEGRSHITGLEHALRCACLMSRNSEELGFIGLVHDLARPLSDVFHGEVMAEIVRDRVSTDGYHVLRTHGEYQAALAHKHDFPFVYRFEPWNRDAKVFAAAEVRSFRRGCPSITFDAAELMLRHWLD